MQSFQQYFSEYIQWNVFLHWQKVLRVSVQSCALKTRVTLKVLQIKIQQAQRERTV